MPGLADADGKLGCGATASPDTPRRGGGAAVVLRSQPVSLTTEQKGELLKVIEFWVRQVPGGYPEMPDGVYALRNALHDDLHDTQQAEKADQRLTNPRSAAPAAHSRPTENPAGAGLS